MDRRTWLGACAGGLALLALLPLRALAAVWNRQAFEAQRVDSALQGLGVREEQPSPAIELVAPQMAENGAIVQIEVTSRIPNTEAIAIVAEKNPTPLIANFLFAEGAEPYVLARIKLAETGELKAVVKAGDKYYTASRMVEVAVGGCG